MAKWDVIVIGLGGVGSAAAYHLAAAGHKVLGLDQYPSVHALGSSHGQNRIIRQAYFEHPAYVPLLRRAYELWNELELATDQRLFHRTGLVEMGPGDGVVIPGVLRSAIDHGLDVEQLSVAEVTKRWPGIVGDEDWQAVIERDAGYLRVEACVEAHLRRAKEESATLRHETAVVSWRADGQGVEVMTDTGTERAGRLVIAGGPWSGQLLHDLDLPLRVLRKHQYWFSPISEGYTEDAGLPCFFHETSAGYFYGFPSAGRSGVKVARHSGGTTIDGPTQSHPADPKDQSMVQAYVDRYLPGLGDRIQSQSGCYYTVTKDEHFVVGTHPMHDQVTVVAGLSGHGFKFTSVLGEIASQIAVGAATSMDTTLLRIQR